LYEKIFNSIDYLNYDFLRQILEKRTQFLVYVPDCQYVLYLSKFYETYRYSHGNENIVIDIYRLFLKSLNYMPLANQGKALKIIE